MLKLNLQFFGGRGSSSGGSKGSVKRRTQREHNEEWSDPPPLEEQLMKQNNIDYYQAYEQVKAIQNYSGSDYGAIRDAQYMNNKNSMYYAEAQAIEKFIAQSPVWAGGELYRGVGLPNDTISQLVKGATIDMRGMSSWSTDKSIADNFANHNSSGKSAVIFKTAKTKQGTSITHLSQFGKSESEVLISGKATWTIKNVTKSGGVTIVEVVEN